MSVPLFIDSSSRSHLVVCKDCNFTDGPFESRMSAHRALVAHRKTHPAPATPGLPGRPKTLAAQCEADDCTLVPIARNLCSTHYKQARRRECIA